MGGHEPRPPSHARPDATISQPWPGARGCARPSPRAPPAPAPFSLRRRLRSHRRRGARGILARRDLRRLRILLPRPRPAWRRSSSRRRGRRGRGYVDRCDRRRGQRIAGPTRILAGEPQGGAAHHGPAESAAPPIDTQRCHAGKASGRKPRSCTRSGHHTPLPAPPLAAFSVMPTTLACEAWRVPWARPRSPAELPPAPVRNMAHATRRPTSKRHPVANGYSHLPVRAMAEHTLTPRNARASARGRPGGTVLIDER